MKNISQFFFLILLVLSCQVVYSQQPYQLTKKDTSEVRFVNARKFWIYKVEKGETMYSISQKFKIPQEEILQFNKEISESGLKAKMKLWIPAYSWLNKSPAITELENEVKEEEIISGKKRKLRILVLTGLHLQKNYTGNPLDDSSFVKEYIANDIRENLEYWEGALVAAKNLAKSDRRIELSVLDTESDSMKTRRILLKYESEKPDFIITNETGSVLRSIDAFSKKNKILLISSAINSSEVIRDNELAYAMSPSSLLQCKMMGDASAELFNGSVCVLLKSGVPREDERMYAFKSGWMNHSKAGHIKHVNFSRGFTKAVLDSMSKQRMNVVFVPSSNEDIISSLLSALKEAGKDYRMAVIGLPTWLYSQSIEPELFDTCNAHVFSSSHLDITRPELTEFRKKFRDHYHCEPLDAAYTAHDALSYAVHISSSGNRRKEKSKSKTDFEGLYSTYHFSENREGRCFENEVIHLYRFEKGVPVHFRTEKFIE